MTLRELFTMAEGRRVQRRVEIVAQARLVWEIGETDIAEYLRSGALTAYRPPKLDPQLQAEVDRKIDEIMRTGKLTVE